MKFLLVVGSLLSSVAFAQDASDPAVESGDSWQHLAASSMEGLDEGSIRIGNAHDAPTDINTNLLGNTRASHKTHAVTFNAADDTVEWVGHELADGDRVYFTTEGELPAALAPETAYFVINAEPDTFQISAVEVGAAALSLNGGSVGASTIHYGGLQTQKASLTSSGIVTTSDQTMKGTKTFVDGIKFHTTMATLSTYVEGSFTPSLYFGATLHASSNQAGRYTRIGDVVHFRLFLSFNKTGSPSGNLSIQGLPYLASNYAGLSIEQISTGGGTTFGRVTAFTEPVDTKVSIQASGSPITPSDFGTGTSTIGITGFYFVN